MEYQDGSGSGEGIPKFIEDWEVTYGYGTGSGILLHGGSGEITGEGHG